jgi:hypothetical protein
MRNNLTVPKLRAFMAELATKAVSKGNVYFTGGATALLLGMREQTIDVDIKFDPEPQGAFEALRQLKNSLDINVELASPADFIPVAPDWKQRSLFIAQNGSIGFYHFDLAAQALSKIERAHAQDLADARDFLRLGGIDQEQLWSYFLRIKKDLVRYPAVDAESFERKLKHFLEKK